MINPKFMIIDILDWISYGLVETAFFFDCWGPFGWWVYPLGCKFGGLVTVLGEKWGVFVENPDKNLIDEPCLIDIRKVKNVS